MRGYSSNYCVLPKSGKCNVSDETVLQWKSGIDKCDLPEAQFIVDYEHGSITHKCSGKPVCPSGGKASNGKEVVISSKCPPMQLKKRFTRTMCKSISHCDILKTSISYYCKTLLKILNVVICYHHNNR